MPAGHRQMHDHKPHEPHQAERARPRAVQQRQPAHQEQRRAERERIRRWPQRGLTAVKADTRVAAAVTMRRAC